MIMRVAQFVFLTTILFVFSSCTDEDSDAIYLTNDRIILIAERPNDYYEYQIEFTWNNIRMSDQVGFIFFESSNEISTEEYIELIESGEYYYYNFLSKETVSYSYYDWDTETPRYYKLVAFNNEGEYVFSNTLYL